MDLLRAVVLGIVEGLTEFLPVSSTGHMLLVEPLIGVDPALPHWKVFLFVSQIGAIAAVIVYFWRDLWRRVFHPPTRRWDQHILTKLVVAMIPTVAIGYLLDDFMEATFETGARAPLYIAGALIVGGGLMEFIDRRFRRTGPMTLEDVTLPQAFGVGALQCLSMWPGTSRSAASIMSGMVLGMTPSVATEFSFYLAIPTMLAAGAKRMLDNWTLIHSENAGVILVGTATAFLVALGVVAKFMSYVRRYRFTPFAVYRVVLGAVVLAYYLAR